MPEARVLLGDAPPHVPTATGLEVRIPCGRRMLGSHRGVLHATAVGDEHQIVLRQVDGRLVTFVVDVDADGEFLRVRAVRVALEEAGRGLDLLDRVLSDPGALAFGSVPAADRKLDVLDLGVVVELHAVRFEVLHHRQDHRLVLVVSGEPQRAEVRQTADVVDVPFDVQFHFQRGMPVLEREHGAPVQPEVGFQHLVVEEIGDRLVVQFLVRSEEQFHDLHRGLVAQPEFALESRILPAVLGGAAQRIVGVVLVEPVILVEHGDAFGLDRRDRAEQVPHHLEVVVHLAPAAHDIAEAGDVGAVARPAGHRVLFEDVDVLARHLRISHQIAGRRQRRKSRADDVRRLAVDTRRLLRSCERFIVATGIIHIPPP